MANCPSETRDQAAQLRSGLPIGSPASAPVDANIAKGQVVLYLDEAGNNLKIRVKYSNGTLKTATIALA